MMVLLPLEPMVNENGVLEVALDEAGERNTGVVRIEEDGEVYINEDSEVGADSEDDSNSMSTEEMNNSDMDMEDMQK